MRNARWVIVCIASLLVCAALFAFFYGVQASVWYSARQMAREEPRLAMVPQPLRDTTVNTAAGMPLSSFGYTFEVPWKDVGQVKERGQITSVVFKSGPAIVFFNPSGTTDLVKALQGRDPTQAQQLRALYGQETMASDYDLEKAILSMTPDRVSIFMPRKQAIVNSTLLMMKSVKMRKEQSALYLVQTPNLRGFQKGDPSRDETTFLELFDNQDHRFEVWIAADKAGAVKITQADVNRIIQTLHPIAEAK